MKKLFLLCLLCVSLHSFSQQREPEFMLLFGNDFTNDSVTIYADGILVARHIKLKTRMIDPENLVIDQNSRRLQVRPYNGPNQTLKRIPIKNSLLQLDILLNNVWRTFRFDLTKGKYLYAEYPVFRIGWSGIKVFTIRQSDQSPIFF